ncbi:iron complex transport system permease protein [Okibacterium sp. HSC-33S16]|uniref:FecCD family ABC transporter permease n=1 Tax=Okibacterium sp. HSC-33S16 TaxID=2910965 RepID=UPI00209C7695|nr:iron chelate uptake ABC transporter family permease subunit [Okibacterium sp. HSC-33S16]MCP2032086.1 iron complex transport system permease protein [Okibacterium sp. HSC-33S16]
MSATATASIASPKRPPVLRLGGWLSLPVRARSLVLGGILVVAILATGLATLTLGKLGIAPSNLLPTLLGQGEGRDEIVLTAFRGPRLVVGIAAGAALAVSGALFQTVTRNPLGSPDVIGLTSGASAGAAAFGLMWPGILPLPVGALVGAFVAMALVYVGTGTGFSSPSRMLLIGIGVSAMSLAFVQWVLVRAGREQATVLATYLNGSLAARDWDHAATIWTAIVVLIPSALLLSRRLQLVEMGDEQADALGARSTSARALSILVAIGLATAAVSVAGPVSFIALVAPQIARRLSRSAGPNILASALMGAFLLSLADLLTQQLPFDVTLPVGVLTAILGGIYLGYLLIAQWRKGTI